MAVDDELAVCEWKWYKSIYSNEMESFRTYFVVRFAVDWYDWGGDFRNSAARHGLLRWRWRLMLGVESSIRVGIIIIVVVVVNVGVNVIVVMVDVTGIVVILVVCASNRLARSTQNRSGWCRLSDVQAIPKCYQLRAEAFQSLLKVNRFVGRRCV